MAPKVPTFPTLMGGLPAAIAAAQQRINPHILLTPVTRARWVADVDLHLKCEHLQHTGSFKLRGALNRLLQLTDAERAQGVLAASTGNHGLGVARAAEVAGVAARVFVPAGASPAKLEAMAAYGVDIETIAGDGLPDGLAAELAARARSQQTGQVFVSPYNDADVIAGQGTIGAELVRQLPGIDVVFVAVGGGGLISGIAAALKSHNPAVRVVGCWPENAPTMERCLGAGHIHAVTETPTISDGTAGGLEDDALTFELCRLLIDQTMLVSEAEIHSAMRLLAEQERWIVEGSAGVALAGAMKARRELSGSTTAVVLCGRNIDYSRFLDVTAHSGSS